MSDAWSREEVEAAVADYFAMLEKDLTGLPYNKAEHNRQLQKLLRNRSHGSIERKHQNISAVLIQLGFPYIDGYKPLGNYQDLLASVVQERAEASESLQALARRTVEALVEQPPVVTDVLSILVPPPVRERERQPARLGESSAVRAPRFRRNYLEIEARNQSLGRAGEELVLEFEHKRLWQAGKRNLADRIEHVARTRGDYLGYDVQSFGVSWNR